MTPVETRPRCDQRSAEFGDVELGEALGATATTVVLVPAIPVNHRRVYLGSGFGRQPKAITKVVGTGLTTPSFA